MDLLSMPTFAHLHICISFASISNCACEWELYLFEIAHKSVVCKLEIYGIQYTNCLMQFVTVSAEKYL